MLTVLIKVFTIFSILAIGLIANKTGILPTKSAPYLTNLLLMITTPCLILSTMGSSELSARTFRLTIEVLVGCSLCFAAACAASYFVMRLLKYHPPEDRGVLMVIMASINCGFMGFPVSKAVFGDMVFFLFIVQNIVFNVYIYSIAYIQLNYGTGEQHDKKSLLRAFLNIPIFATVIGCVILFAQIRLPGPVLDLFSTVGDATIPLSMIIVGVQLGESRPGKIFKNKKLVIASLANVIIMPFLAFLIASILPFDNLTKLTMVFSEAFPCAVTTSAITLQSGKNDQLAAEGITLTTIFSLVTLPVVASLLMYLYM
jgi:predicted permease